MTLHRPVASDVALLGKLETHSTRLSKAVNYAESKGTRIASGAMSWSSASTASRPRASPPREKSPTATFALVSREILRASGSAAVRARVSWTFSKMASVWGAFFAAGP